MYTYKKIHIGNLIEKRVIESQISNAQICNFLKCNDQEVEQTYLQESIDSIQLLRWSKLLKYDFFRIYSQHLILYSPPSAENYKIETSEKSSLPQFRKNFYSKEIIEFILEMIESKEKTKTQIMEEYRIPKTTLYKWITKYSPTTN